MPLVLVTSNRFIDHQTPPGHPERPERATVMLSIAEAWRAGGGDVVAPRAATTEQLLRVHDGAYIRQIDATAGTADVLDPDTYVSLMSAEVARLAAGAAVDAVERAWQVPGERTLALVRPPGHHAERDHAMGFCLFNNVAVAAAHACHLGATRVAVVDFDVHHGNGTEHAFEDDPSVLYVSLHQSPFYPGTGRAADVGRDEGRGLTVNVPLEVGAADDDYRLVFAEVVVPVLEQFAPEILVVSAGFDAHERDPLAGMRLSTAAFGAMTRELRRVADRCCAGRIAAVVEGGYDLPALADCLAAVVEALGPDVAEPPVWPACAIAPTRGRAAVRDVAGTSGVFWRLGGSR